MKIKRKLNVGDLSELWEGARRLKEWWTVIVGVEKCHMGVGSNKNSQDFIAFLVHQVCDYVKREQS